MVGWIYSEFAIWTGVTRSDQSGQTTGKVGEAIWQSGRSDHFHVFFLKMLKLFFVNIFCKSKNKMSSMMR